MTAIKLPKLADIIPIRRIEQRITGAKSSGDVTNVLTCPPPCFARVVPCKTGLVRCPDCGAVLLIDRDDVAWFHAR